MHTGAEPLQPVDLTLYGGALAFAAQPLQDSSTFGEVPWAGNRRRGFSSYARDKLIVHCT